MRARIRDAQPPDVWDPSLRADGVVGGRGRGQLKSAEVNFGFKILPKTLKSESPDMKVGLGRNDSGYRGLLTVNPSIHTFDVHLQK